MSRTGCVTLSKSCFLVHKLGRITSHTRITVTGHLQVSVVASGGLADRFEAGVGRGHAQKQREGTPTRCGQGDACGHTRTGWSSGLEVGKAGLRLCG